jgi:hypothetical protein
VGILIADFQLSENMPFSTGTVARWIQESIDRQKSAYAVMLEETLNRENRERFD